MTLHYKENLRRKRENEHEKSWGIWCRAKSENYRHSEPWVTCAKNRPSNVTADVKTTWEILHFVQNDVK